MDELLVNRGYMFFARLIAVSLAAMCSCKQWECAHDCQPWSLQMHSVCLCRLPDMHLVAWVVCLSEVYIACYTAMVTFLV